ncbi:MAG: glycosyltransferase [Hadesarchaea archaeon]|nr:MAG: glycosyltransferase [Hadesarchaea archaeon]
MPLLSVIMSVFNGEKYVKETVESILNQSFRDFEFIIVNDGSTDGTPRILRNFDDDRIKIIDQENQGPAKARNRAIRVSKGKYIGIIDCGDVAFKKKMEIQINFLERNKEIYGVGAWANIVDEDGKIVGVMEQSTEFKDIKKTILKSNTFIHSSMVFRRKLFDKIGLYDESFKFAHDYDLVIRAVRKFKIVNIPQVLLNYRISEESISFQKRKQQSYYALKIRARALGHGYPTWQCIYLIRPFFSFLVPADLKNVIVRRFLWRPR